MTASTGSWTHGPSSYDYVWYLDGVAISGATSATYTVQASDVGHTIDVSVTASNTDGSTSASTIARPSVTMTSTPDAVGAVGPTTTSWVTTGIAATTTCSVDGAAFSACSSPQTRTVAAGPHSLRVRVTNQAGSTTTTTGWASVEGTVIDGTIASDATWTTAASPYIIVNATISHGTTLTINPGVVVKGYEPTSTLTIDGALSAIGTSSSRIVFTSIEDDATDAIDSSGDGATAPGSGDWNAIVLTDHDAGSTISYTNLLFGGGSGATAADAMVQVTGGSATLSHDSLTESSVSGLHVDGGADGTSTTATIDNSTIKRNHYNGVDVSNAPISISDSVLIENGTNGLHLALDGDYAASGGAVDHNQIRANRNFGVKLDGGAADGSNPSGTHNNIYDNGLDPKLDGSQLTSEARTDADWSGNYWGTGQGGSGPDGLPCPEPEPVDPIRPHLWGGSTRPYPGYPRSFSTLVGPVSSAQLKWYSSNGPDSSTQFAATGDYYAPWVNGCQEDDVVDTPAASGIFDIPGTDEPPPVNLGLDDTQTYGGCMDCYLKSHPHANRPKVPHVHRGDPVDTATGALQESFTDETMPGPGDPFIWPRNYNSNDPSVGALGAGWTVGYSNHLSFHDNGDITYTSETGQQEVFTLDQDGDLVSPIGTTGTLTNEQDAGFSLLTTDSTQYRFDIDGLLTSITPRGEPATSFSYTAGQLTTITDSAGRHITLDYASADPTLLERVTLPDGRYVEYGYTARKLTSVRDLRGKTTTYSYDAAGLLATITDPNGNRTLDTHYNATTGRVDWQKDALDNETTFAWDDATQTSTTTDPNGHVTTDRYYENVLISTTNARGKTTSYTYDANLNVASTPTPTGQITTTRPDQYGNTISRCVGTTTPLCETQAYTADSQLASTQTQSGKTTSFAYTTSGQLESTIAPDGGETDFSYDPDTGQVSSINDAAGNTWTYTYDDQGNETSKTSPLGNTTSYTYDTTGRMTSKTSPRGNAPGATAADYTTTYTYDDGNNLLATTDPYGKSTTSNYDDAGNLASTTTKRSKTTTYSYDADNRLLSTSDPLSHTTTTTYDAAGNVASTTDPTGNETTYSYDPDNNLSSKTMPRGNETGATPADYTYTYSYDDDDRQIAITDPTAHQTQTSYDEYGRVHVETDELGHTKTTTHDPDGNVTRVTDGVGNHTDYTYDNNGLVLTKTDERGKATTYAYDPLGDLTSTTTPLGETTSYTYDADGRLATTIDPRGNALGDPASYTTTDGYDADGNRTSVTDALGEITTRSYDHDGRLASKTDASSKTWSYSYLDDGSLASATNPLGGVASYTYDDSGNTTSSTDESGNETSYTYNADDLLETKVMPRGNETGATPADYTYSYAYDADSNQTSIEDPTGHTQVTSYDRLDRADTQTDELAHATTQTFDAAGNLTRSTDALGDHVDYTYDADNRLASAADRRGKTTSYVYTASGLVASTTTPLGEKTTYTYDDDERLQTSVDARGNVSGGTPANYTTTYTYDAAGNQQTVKDQLAHTTTYSYDRAGRLSSKSDPKSHAWAYTYYPNGLVNVVTAPDTGTTTYAYDGLGDVTTKTDARAHDTTYTYDQAGRILSTSDPLAKLWTYSYDADGNPLTTTTAIGNASPTPAIGRITSTYDALDRLTATSYGDATPTVSYAYDAAGNQTSMSDGAGTRTTTYDAANRLTDTTRGTDTFHYDLDANGNTTLLTQPDASTVAYAYDDDNRLQTVADHSRTTSYGYDAAGHPTSVAFPNGTTETDTFARDGRLTTVANMQSATVLSKFVSTLDSAGNPTLVATTRGATTTNEAYTYDANDRVLKVCKATTCSGTPDRITYAYDKEGNQTSLARVIGGVTTTTTSTYNNANALTVRTTAGTPTNYTYDGNGNQLTAGTRTNTFNLANELTSTSTASSTSIYTFDGNANRLTTATGASVTKFLWNTNTGDLPQLALTEDASGTTTHSFIYGLAALESDAGYLQHDQTGSITDVTDPSGVPQWAFSYEPFGVAKAQTKLVPTAPDEPLRFAGGHLDTESGNYYLNARQYDPNQSRFISRDPLTPTPGSSTYTYASNQPGVMSDPSGMMTITPTPPPGEQCDGIGTNGATAHICPSPPRPKGKCGGPGQQSCTIDGPLKPIDGCVHTAGYSCPGKPAPTTDDCKTPTGPGMHFSCPDTTPPTTTIHDPIPGDNACKVLNLGDHCTGDVTVDDILSGNNRRPILTAKSIKASCKPGDQDNSDADPHPLIDEQAEKHILEGEEYPNGKIGGGHRAGTGHSGKTEFPDSWSDDKILDEISDVATDPASTSEEDGNATIVEGFREEVEIRVVIRDGRIVTGYPIGVEPNP